ncbi:MAG: hypothetical protein APF84_13650 [Gracilibacter sp. BRH_c7a]|nr:MAG: hypothetical protein APF84_13650 [Gracilibacter sp. BRH_c7a]
MNKKQLDVAGDKFMQQLKDSRERVVREVSEKLREKYPDLTNERVEKLMKEVEPLFPPGFGVFYCDIVECYYNDIISLLEGKKMR